MLSALLLGQTALMVAAPSLWPQPAAVTGEDDLRGGDPGRRVAAVIRLGTVGTPEALRRIEPFLSAPDSSLRLAAARALVRAGDDQALARITEQASTQAAPARLEALMILREAAALPAPARDAAERALGDGDAAMRLAALELLTLHPSRDSVPPVAATLADGNREVRLAAVTLLALTPDPRGLLPLLDRLESADHAERLALIEALAHYRAVHPRLDAGPALLRQLDDPNEDIRLAAVEALGRLRWPPAVLALGTMATQGPHDPLGRRAARALGAIGDEPAVKVLANLLRSPAPTEEVKAALVQAGAMAVKPVAGVLRDGFSTSAIAAAEILALIGDRSATSALCQPLTNAVTNGVAISAAVALMVLRDPRAVPALVGAMASPRYAASAGVREACLNALTAIGDARAGSVVHASAQDPDPRVRAAALNLEGAVRAQMPQQLWVARLRDQDATVRLAALRALSAVGGPSITLPAAVESILVDALSVGGAAGRAAAEVLSSFQLNISTLRELLVLVVTLPSPVRARLCPALAHAASPATDELLANLLSADLAPGVRAAAAWAAQTRRTEPALWRALARAQGDRESAVRGNAMVTSTAASAASLSLLPVGRGWVRLRVRMTAPGGALMAGLWVRITAGVQAVWGLTDESGEAAFADLPPGPYRLSTAAADQLALTSATASGRSPATTPVGP